MSFATARFDQLLLKLLSPDMAEREAADTLLWRLVYRPEVTLAKPGGVMRAALLALPDPDAFLAELLAWWSHMLAAKFATSFPDSCDPDLVRNEWPAPTPTAFPLLTGGAVLEGAMAGQGVTKLLAQLADLLAPQLPMLERCLSHVDWQLPHMAGQVLTDLGPAARPALPALIARVAESRNRGGLQDISLSQVVGEDEEQIRRIITEIGGGNLGSTLPALFDELCELTQIPPDLLDTVFALLEKPTPVEERRWLLTGCAHLARRFSHRIAYVRYHVLAAAATGDVRWHEHIATALGRVGDPLEDEPLLLELATAGDPVLRMRAHYASANWPVCSSAMLAATAADLGNYAAHDEQPHYAALHALTCWGRKALAALPRVMEFFETAIEDGSGSIYELVPYLEALGADAAPLWSLARRWQARYDAPDGDEETEETSVEEALADPAFELPLMDRLVLEMLVDEAPAMQREIDALEAEEAKRRARVDALIAELGIPQDEHIPGTEPESVAGEPDIFDRLEAWLQQHAPA